MNKLTENTIRKAEILKKQYKIYDGDGMFLLIHPNGSKYWRMKYTFNGKSKLASFGVWPAVSLKDAREKRHEAKQNIKMGINPVDVNRKNKQQQKNLTEDKVKYITGKNTNTSSVFQQWFKLLSPSGRVGETEESLKLLMSNVFDNTDWKTISLLDKQDLNKILGNIYSNRRGIFKIFWEFYLSVPLLNIVVLFLLLLILMDFLPAVLTTALYFIITVCTSVAFGLWEGKNLQ